MRGETYYEKHEKVALVGASVAVAGSLVGCSWFGGNDEKLRIQQNPVIHRKR